MCDGYMTYIDGWLTSELKDRVCILCDCNCNGDARDRRKWIDEFKTEIKDKIFESYYRGRIEVAQVIMGFVTELNRDSKKQVP